LIEEVGTAGAGQLWGAPDVIAASRLVHVEARAALAAARCQLRISDDVLASAVAGLELLWSQLSVVSVDEALMRLAGDLASEHALRGVDAVHLAAAVRIGADVFSSADGHLCTSASTAGFHVANPMH